MKELSLTKGMVAIVDDDDFEFLSQWKWSFDGQYAVRGHYLGRVDGKDKYKKLYLHRIINQTPKGMETDHINRDKLDNRKCNLKNAKRGGNSRNHNAHKNNITGVRGVVWYKQTKKYRASITIDGKRHHLGYFHSIEAAKVVREYAEKVLCNMN